MKLVRAVEYTSLKKLARMKIPREIESHSFRQNLALRSTGRCKLGLQCV